MSSVAQNRAAGNAAIQAGTLKPAAQPMGSVVANSPGPTITPYPQTPNPYIRTPLPAISTQQPDQQRNWQSGTVPQDRLIGIPLNANPVISAQTITNIVRVPSTVSGGILLETNGQKNPVQNILNVQGSGTVTASVNAQGTLTLTGTSGSATVVNTLAVKRWSLIQAIQGTALATGNGEQVLLDHLTIGNSNGTQAAGGPTATFGPYTQAQAGTGAGAQ